MRTEAVRRLKTVLHEVNMGDARRRRRCGRVSRCEKDRGCRSTERKHAEGLDGCTRVHEFHWGMSVETSKLTTKFNFVVSQALNPPKARVSLRLALTQSSNPREIQTMFDTFEICSPRQLEPFRRPSLLSARERIAGSVRC